MANYKKITSSNEMQISEMTNLTSTKMGDPSLDYDLPIEKDIPITQDNFSSDYYKSKKKVGTMKTTRKGNMIMMCYNSNGEPLIVIGPHWPFTICMMVFINTFIFFYFHFLKNILHRTVKNIGLGISFVQIFSYFLIFLMNPGIPQKELWIENYFKNKNNSSRDEIDSYRICNICKIVRRNSDNTHHCDECNICIKGVENHCSWISKCISKKNKKIYFVFLGSTFCLLVYFILALFSLFFISNKKNDNN
jgi:hypothetical protein